MNTHQSGGTGGTGGAPHEPSVEDILAAAVRAESPAQESQDQALAAFRAARDAGALTARTRRRDDWRPHRPRRFTARAWRATAGALLASLTLGGVAVATFGVPHVPDRPAKSPESPPPSTASPPASSTGSGTPGQQTGESTPSSSAPAPSVSASPEDTPRGSPPRSRSTEVHCRNFEKVTGRGNALNATAWQRLVQAAGGEEHVPAYCAALLGYTPSPEPTPEKTPEKSPENKPEDETGKGPAENGKGQQQTS
ncbi:hypothetical protein OG949_08035 [Streptomyces scopuliridis]|uniref:hypothetical protein n=1 Tax=Streptomyces scopuliridis TaxID=452529 RepID=UPI002DDA5ACD|nr:hypothetical protein [Streptomyces scopuliridis]WSB32814.1 hypothetical protein OG949_08035 [Streptomyces scopuliridis]